MYRTGAILAFIGLTASAGGYEQGMYGVLGWIIRTAIFFVLMVVCHRLAENAEKRKRAKRAGTRKAQNKNKYYIVYR